MASGAADSDRGDEVVVVGRVGAPHGVRGEVHIHSYTTPADNLLGYQPWLFRRKPEGRAGSRRSLTADWSQLEVTQLRPHQDHYLAHVAGYPEREDVAALKGMQIGVPRRQLPAPELDEFYWRDLIGTQVVSADDRVLGVVAGLLETGVHDVLRVRPPEQGQSETLIPFVKAYVLSVDAEKIRVDWDPEWLA